MKRSGGQKSIQNELLAVIRRLEARVAEQDRLIAEKDAVIAALQVRVGELEGALAKARKNSSTSSKPPSSDIVKANRRRSGPGEKKRRIGGQPGHPKHDRPAFSVEEIDEVHEHRLDSCPDCGGSLSPAGTEVPRTIQQIEIEAKPVRVDEHRGLAFWCANCEKLHFAPLPPEVEKGGLVGPRLTTIIAYLKGACHASFSTVRKYLRDVLGVRISRGQLSRIIQKVSAALETAYKELIEKLPAQLKLNVDETGHKENGERFWTWCFRAEAFALFKISGSRGSDVLFETLGHEFGGVLGCDYFSAYRKYMKDCDVLVQFCLAHLIRDLRYLTTLRSPSTVAYGERLLEGMRQLFNLFHSRHALTEHGFVNALNHKREEIMALALDDVPTTQEAQNLAKRFRLHGEAYFRFITTPGVDPTNNLAEQAIRLVVIDRVVTQGTRSERGRTWCERIWTVMATCAQQGRSAFDYLCAAVRANFTNQPCPSLLPDPP